jgi:hypothetical protein
VHIRRAIGEGSASHSRAVRGTPLTFSGVALATKAKDVKGSPYDNVMVFDKQ